MKKAKDNTEHFHCFLCIKKLNTSYNWPVTLTFVVSADNLLPDKEVSYKKSRDTVLPCHLTIRQNLAPHCATALSLRVLLSVWPPRSTYVDMAGVAKKKSAGATSRFWTALRTIWQEKHLVLFKTEYTLLVTAFLWFLEIGVNVWVIQKVACK